MITTSRRRILPLFLAAAAFAAVAAPAGGARAQEEGAKEEAPETKEPATTALTLREFPKLKFKIEVPKIWKESASSKGVKWGEVAGRAESCEITYWDDRRDLDQIEKNLRTKALEEKWGFVDDPRRTTVDGSPAFYMLIDIPGEYPVRQLFVVIDTPQGTYLLTYGDLAGDFNRELIDKVVGSFKRHEGGDASGPVPGGEATAGENWGCVPCQKSWPTNLKFCGECGAKNGPLVPEKKKYGCAACKKEWPESQRFCGECGAKTGPMTDKEK